MVNNSEVRMVTAERLLPAMRELKDNGYDYLSNVTGVDYPQDGEIEVVYHLYSIARREAPLAVVKARTPRDDARLPSVVGLYRSADLQEREIFDLFGVRFEGHPNLRRILLWDEFEGYPLRKDYEPEDEDRPVELG